MLMRRFLPFVLATALTCLGFAQEVTKETKTAVLGGIVKVLNDRAFVPGIDLKKWPEHLAKHQEAIDKAETEDTFSREVNRALREFGFSHISLRTPRRAQARTRTFVIGLGFTARFEDGAMVVRSVVTKSAAETAGIQVGDKIIEVDGKAPEASTTFDGEEGKEVALKVKRGDEEPKEIKLKRERVSTVRPETLTWVGDESAVLRIFTFSRGYDRANIEKLIKEANEKAKYLVLDLRANGGGAVNNLQHLLSLLLPNDTVIGTFVNKTSAENFVKETKGEPSDVKAIAKWAPNKYKTSKRSVEPFSGKIAVLVNRGSASASEICTTALRELAKAPVIGAKTAGAVLASVYARLPEGWELQHPVSDYVSVNGIRLEANPIVPDVEETTRPADGKDPAVEKAIELLKGK